jgi:hypothetical protein
MRDPVPQRPDAFILRLWNGETGPKSAAVAVRDRLRIPGLDTPGTAGVDLPRSISTQGQVAVLRALAEAFYPDIGALTSTEMLRELDQGTSAGPVIYVSDATYELRPLPQEVVSMPTGAPGHMLKYEGWAGGSFGPQELRALADSFVARETVQGL